MFGRSMGMSRLMRALRRRPSASNEVLDESDGVSPEAIVGELPDSAAGVTEYGADAAVSDETVLPAGDDSVDRYANYEEPAPRSDSPSKRPRRAIDLSRLIRALRRRPSSSSETLAESDVEAALLALYDTTGRSTEDRVLAATVDEPKKDSRLTDVPLYASLLRHLDLPDTPRRYLQQVAAAEVADTIPFSEDEVDIKWQIRSDGDERRVFAIAVPKDVIDRHVRLMEQAGSRPAATFSKAVALAFAAGTPNTIVVGVASTQAGSDSVPQVVNRLVFPGGNTSPQARAEAVAGAVEQMAGYYQDYQAFGSADEGESLPVVVTGEVQDQATIAEALQQVLQRDVIPCAPDLDYPEHFPASEYAVNLGLSLASRATGKEGVVSRKLTSINQLPARHLPRPLPALPIAVFAVLLILGAGTLYAQQTEVTPLIDESTSLSEEVAQAERRYDRIRKEAKSCTIEACSSGGWRTGWKAG